MRRERGDVSANRARRGGGAEERRRRRGGRREIARRSHRIGRLRKEGRGGFRGPERPDEVLHRVEQTGGRLP